MNRNKQNSPDLNLQQHNEKLKGGRGKIYQGIQAFEPFHRKGHTTTVHVDKNLSLMSLSLE